MANTMATVMKVKPKPRRGNVEIDIGPGESRLLAEKGAGTEFRLTRILAPIDFSDCSLKALDYAAGFARSFQAWITLIHVVQVPYGTGEAVIVDLDRIRQRMREDSERQLAALVTKLTRDQEISMDIIVREGNPYAEIVRVAQEQRIDLIIIATHGHTGIKHVLLGSVAERVVRHASCPVLVVREHEHEFVPPLRSTGRARSKAAPTI